MKWLVSLIACLSLGACAAREPVPERTTATATAQVGIVNHTGNFIYSATVDGSGGGRMSAWGAAVANMCCTSIPRVWHPGMKVLVRWNMPVGTTDVIKEKIVEVEKYDKPGDIYMHFFPNDEIRVVVTNSAGYSQSHPIPPPVEPKEKSGVK
ncbi:DUF3304 domain-containing protein [Rugamonas aquatica]|uniref:DUF3304 domain-containing protein n=1 Tax=Rugamonas aquatica TaxID=2743357 RepID=A0A6A7N3I9_9BURK|nr:DUF3304 domain-containing protein [Rugamonas aquatica]MQA39595.1 DUF3304 domain-containing protein [Rugamonas aquatica]